MIAMRSPTPERGICGVNVILLSDGREMYLDAFMGEALP